MDGTVGVYDSVDGIGCFCDGVRNHIRDAEDPSIEIFGVGIS